MSYIKLFEEFLNENLTKKNNDKIEKVRKLAKKYNYTEVKDLTKFTKDTDNDEDGINNIAAFIDPNDKKKKTYVIIWADEDKPDELNVNWYYYGGPAGNDKIEVWTKDSKWEDMIEGKL